MEDLPQLDGDEQPALPAAPEGDSAPPPLPPEEPVAEETVEAKETEGTKETETTEAADEPHVPSVPEDPSVPSPEEPAPAEDTLGLLADEALRHRLSAADEERATRLLKETLLQGREGVGRAIEHLPKLPWLIGVNGVSAAWVEMKPTFRTRLLAGLARVDTEAARRVRLSLARGLFKQDVPAALKIAVSVAKDLREKETGAVTHKNAQIFTNVFIGRAKPWMAQLPLADLKPNEAELVLHVGLMAVFTLPHPPATQLGIIKWGAAAGRLEKLHPAALEAIKRGLGRWSGKWRHALHAEVKGLPPELAELVAPPAGRGARAPEPERRAEREPRESREPREVHEPAGTGEHPEPPEGALSLPADSEHEETPEPTDRLEHAEELEREREEAEEDDEDEDEEEERERASAPPTEPVVQTPRPRPVYESKTVPSPHQGGGHGQQQQQQGGRRGQQQQPYPGGASFNLPDTLRQIEQHVLGLNRELQAAQNKLRQREDETRRAKPPAPNRPAAPIIPGEPTPDELARLNVQLEARNAELQARLDELREDSEARAAAESTAGSSESGGETWRTLLQLKLQEDFEDFTALEKELPDLVVQQHYRGLLRHVFEVLRAEGVALAVGAKER